jgi:hypothetical protein
MQALVHVGIQQITCKHSTAAGNYLLVPFPGRKCHQSSAPWMGGEDLPRPACCHPELVIGCLRWDNVYSIMSAAMWRHIVLLLHIVQLHACTVHI